MTEPDYTIARHIEQLLRQGEGLTVEFKEAPHRPAQVAL